MRRPLANSNCDPATGAERMGCRRRVPKEHMPYAFGSGPGNLEDRRVRTERRYEVIVSGEQGLNIMTQC